VTVQVSRVDLDARKIDLRLVTEPGIHTQLKNEARRAESEQGAKRRRGSSTEEPVPVLVAEPGQEQAAAEGRKPRTRRSGKSTAAEGGAMPASTARGSRKSAGDKQNGSRKKRQK
jgi:ribonuclease R